MILWGIKNKAENPVFSYLQDTEISGLSTYQVGNVHQNESTGTLPDIGAALRQQSQASVRGTVNK